MGRLHPRKSTLATWTRSRTAKQEEDSPVPLIVAVPESVDRALAAEEVEDCVGVSATEGENLPLNERSVCAIVYVCGGVR